MKIAHLCVSCFYIDGFRYQENELVRRHVADGHDVVVIASTESFDASGNVTYVRPSEYLGADGAMVYRLGYASWLPFKRKVRSYPRLRGLLEREAPDVIVFHGLCAVALLTVVDYVRRNPEVTLFADSHEDANNSARTPASKALHRWLYRPVIRRAEPFMEPILCVSIETMQFVASMYGIPESRLEFFPLGANVLLDEEYSIRRERGRMALGVSESEVVFLQSGKIGRAKKLVEALEAFGGVENARARYFVAGVVQPEVAGEVQQAVSADPRVCILGWQSADQLLDLLCAADVYVQPGSQSATMQMSLGARCPVILDDVPSHRVFIDGNGWLLAREGDLQRTFELLAADPAMLGPMAERSHAIASRLLDYRNLARRIVAPVGPGDGEASGPGLAG